MASITLTESAKLSQDMMLAGVIEDIITVDRIWELFPIMGIEGNAVLYNRENTLGDVQGATVGTSITARSAATVTPVTVALKTIIGDIDMDKLTQKTRSNINDQVGFQITAKAKSVARQYADWLVNGVSSTTQFDGMLSLVDAGKTIASTGANGDVLSFEKLDELMDQVTDKDGVVDFLCMHSRELRKFYSLLRTAGGTTPGDIVTLPSGIQVPGYRGTPIFKNDWVPVNQTQGTSTNATTIIAGNFDDGSNMVGLSGLSTMENAGIEVEYVGIHQSQDADIYRVKMYAALALFNKNGLAVATGITPV